MQKAVNKLFSFLKKNQEKLNEELLQAVFDKKDLSIIKELIEKGANVNCLDEDYETPLHYACFNGHAETANALIASKADVRYITKDGNSPLLYACLNGHTETALALIACNTDVNYANKTGANPLHIACLNGHTETALALIASKADVNYAPKAGWTPLHNACLYGRTEILNALIASKADVNYANKKGETPIQVAVKQNHIAVINILFEAGADVLCLSNQEFINKYNKEIKPETKDLIDKITHRALILEILIIKFQKYDKQINDLTTAMNQQISSVANDNINPRFLIKSQDLQEIKYIQNNPELHDYYARMQKSFNEAFLFATI